MITQPGIQTTLPWFEGQLPLQAIEARPEAFGDYFGDDICPGCGGTAYLNPGRLCDDCNEAFEPLQ